MVVVVDPRIWAEVSCFVHHKYEVGEALEGDLEGDLVVQWVEGDGRSQTFEEEDLFGPLEGMVVVPCVAGCSEEVV